MENECPTFDLDSFMGELDQYRGKGWRLTFSGLTYYRPKPRGEKLLQIEFDQTVYLDDEGLVVVDNHK